MYAPKEIAAWFVGRIDREAGDSITPLKLQKLLYYAQAWSLVLLDRPLFDEDFEAWVHGPVVRSVYNEYRRCGFEAIPAPAAAPELDPAALQVLEDVHRIYGERSASALESLTHAEQPWRSARGPLPLDAPSNAVIPRSLIKEFYARMLVESGGAMVPHQERFDASNPVFLGPDGKPLPPPEEDFASEDDRDFAEILAFGLRSLGPKTDRRAP
jgi:uncharacterized phage-associated protein